jgi:hypothetical protein
MRAIDGFTAHFSLLKTRVIEAPEVLVNGAPLIIYCPPITLAQAQKIANYRDNCGEMETLAMIMILLAKNAEGEPLFTIADKHSFMHRSSKDVIGRIVGEMTRRYTIEEQEKN